MTDYKDDINQLHERISDNRDKLSIRVSNTEATAHNTKGQIDLFKWVITGLTLSFYGVCFWLVTETLATKSELQGLKYEVQSFKSEHQDFKSEFQEFKSEFQGLKSEVQSLSAAMERIERKLE